MYNFERETHTMEWIKRNDYKTPEEMIFANLGVSSAQELNEWFRKSYSNKYNIKGLSEAVAFAKTFMNKKVTIVGDYDADGVTATSILYLGLREYGFTDVSYRIPLRFTEGFGISETIIDEIEEGLIITCDNGIAGIKAIKKAKDKGLFVIITDHHEPVIEKSEKVLPEADFIIDPNAISNSADFNGYCGAGLAYKFICELFGFDKAIRYKYLSLAAIGTVADIMQLKEENYVYVRDALKVMRNPSYTSTGLSALINVFHLEKGIKSDDIAFCLGPAINASSRMKDDGAKDAVELLTYNGPFEIALSMAEHMRDVNNQRKKVEAETYQKAISIIKNENRQNLCPLTLCIPSAREGIIGIIAGKLCEEYHVPVLVFTDIEKNGTKLLKGSARSCEGYNIKQAFDKHADLFIKYGGHEGAAGMTISPENFEILTNELNSDAHGFALSDANKVYYDFRVMEQDVPSIIAILEKFAPFGEGNPEPLFCLDIEPTIKFGSYRKILGENQTTIKIFGKTIDAISFTLAKEFESIDEKSKLSIIGKLENNYYQGRAYPQIKIQNYMVY